LAVLRRRVRTARSVERVDDACEADERVLVHLARLGCDPAVPRETRHFLYVPERSDAEAVADALGSGGWATRVVESRGAWLVVAKRVRALSPALVSETRTRLVALVSEHGGVYDGWEAPRP